MAGKILNIIPIYAKFFVKNINSRHLVLQGSRRSAKSVSVYQWMTLRLLSERKECCVICASYPAAMLAVKDFQLATGLVVSGNAIYGTCYMFPNGSVISFKGIDDPTKAQGTSCDYAIIEEALNLDEQIFSVFSMSVREQIFFIYNPTKTSWVDKYIKEDKSNYLKTTWKDNPYLGPEQIEEFENIRKRAESPTASILDIYNKKVYYDGDFSEMGGKVFPAIFTCTDEEYDSLSAIECSGIDFGFVDGADATCVVGAKVFQNCLYLKQYINSRGLSKDKDLAFALADKGFNCYSYLTADHGGVGKTRITALCTAGNYEWEEEPICKGFNITPIRKGRVVDGLTRMLNYDKIIVTASSKDLRSEMGNYELGPEGEERSKHQNLVDAARYATLMQQQIFAQ
jgi:phage terminase large subunit